MAESTSQAWAANSSWVQPGGYRPPAPATHNQARPCAAAIVLARQHGTLCDSPLQIRPVGVRVDKISILMVDDQPGKLLTYEAILGGLGENLIKARSGDDALACL